MSHASPVVAFEDSSEQGEQTFQALGLSKNQENILQSHGYTTPTPVQEKCIPVLLEGKSVLAQAQTGTGKTAAFALPILERLNPKERRTQVLVLVPTRELALQVSKAFSKYGEFLKHLSVASIFGGQDFRKQKDKLRDGAQIVVGTPGRVMDHLRRKTLHLDDVQTVVLDEADEMLNMGFLEDVEWILEKCPTKRQTALFSATMSRQIAKIVERHIESPVEISIAPAHDTTKLIDQFYWQVTPNDKINALSHVLAVEEYQAAIVFVRTRSECHKVCEELRADGVSCAPLNGDMKQSDRERTVADLRAGRTHVVVATDVAARGLDIDCLNLVVNYDLPFDPASYVHRIGRTGRAGRKGRAVLFVTPREGRLLKNIERTTKATVSPFELPTRNDLRVRQAEKIKEEILSFKPPKRTEHYQALLQELEEEHNLTPTDVAMMLLSQREPRSKRERPKTLPIESRSSERRPKGPRDRGERRGARGDRGKHRNGPSRGNFKGKKRQRRAR